jgi:hypothetical protein
MQIRRLVTIEDEIRFEGGGDVDPPLRKVAAIAVIKNPLAGTFGNDLGELITIGEELGTLLAERILKAIDVDKVESFGKACIVGLDGELEHSAAIIHPVYGMSVRKVINAGKAIIPSTKKVGGPGTRIDLPLVYKDAFAVTSHYDGMEVGLPDAPRADEILVALAMTDGGRPHDRIPGLKKEGVKGENGLV